MVIKLCIEKTGTPGKVHLSEYCEYSLLRVQLPLGQCGCEGVSISE